MGAQRKLVDPVVTAPPAEASPVEDRAPFDHQARVTDGDVPTSPAILLQEQLAARLAETTAGAAVVEAETEAPEAKWPMALRIVTIVGLSGLLWGGVFLAAMAILT